MRITLRQLVVFDAVASYGGLVAAAERLNMSQSAASAALKDLQTSLKRPPLIHRSGRTLSLTAEGKRLHSQVHSLLQMAREIEDPAISTRLDDRIEIGMTGTGAHFLPPVIASFKRAYPGIRVNAVVGEPRELAERLANFTLDLVVTDNRTREEGTHLTELFLERSVLIAAPGNRLCARHNLQVRDLEDAEWCMPARVSQTSLRIAEIIRGNIDNLKIAIEIHSDEGVREAVRSGIGISCLPESLVRDDIAIGRLVELKIEGMNYTRPTYLMRPANVAGSLASRLFADHLVKELKQPSAASVDQVLRRSAS